MFNKLSRMLAVMAAAILMLTAVGTAVQAEEAVTGDTFLAQIVGDYQPLFEGATLNPEYDHYWHDYAAAVVGASAAGNVVAYVKSSINAPGYGEQAAAPNFYCGFIDDVTAITFGGEDGKTVTYTKADGTSATYTYSFVRDGAAKGTYGEYEMAMEGFLYKAQEEDSGQRPPLRVPCCLRQYSAIIWLTMRFSRSRLDCTLFMKLFRSPFQWPYRRSGRWICDGTPAPRFCLLPLPSAISGSPLRSGCPDCWWARPAA